MIKIQSLSGKIEESSEIPSRYISKEEASCNCCGEAFLFSPMIKLFNAVREKLAVPIRINSFYRCKKHQEELKKQGYKAATISPHNYGCGMDLTIPQGMTIKELMQAFKKESLELGYGVPRFGHKLYNDTFLHVDLAYLLKNNPCPAAWREGVEW